MRLRKNRKVIVLTGFVSCQTCTFFAILMYGRLNQKMPGRSTAVTSGHALRDRVAMIGRELGLSAETELEVGRRIWGSKRRIDVVLKDRDTRKSLGVECKYQAQPGTAEQKIIASIEDIRSWPIRGILVFSGEGFSETMRSYLISTGVAVEFQHVKKWLELYFAL